MTDQAPTQDPFDKIYTHWAEQAVKRHLDPPTRERWDSIVLRLILSEDPARVRRYSRLEDSRPEGLGADAFELWRKTPPYTENLSRPFNGWEEFGAYEEKTRGSMRRLMERDGLGERYSAMIEAQERYSYTSKPDEERLARARRGQSAIILMGCAGIAAIAVMMLTVLLIIAIRLNG